VGEDEASPTANSGPDTLSLAPEASNTNPEKIIELRAEANGILLHTSNLEAKDLDFYIAEVDRAIVLYHQIGILAPEEAENFQMLGRLLEISALLAFDPEDRLRLLEEAQVNFARAARIDLEADFLRTESQEQSIQPISDPYLALLAWNGRLTRGEVSLEELKSRHGEGTVPATYNPLFWEERFFLIQAGETLEEKMTLFEAAAKEFADTLASMPVEVPYRRGSQRLGEQKFKKIEVIEAWACGLFSLSGSERDGEFSSVLYYAGLSAMEKAYNLPLDSHELGILLSKLHQADPLAFDQESLTALWALKDRFFAKLLSMEDRPPDVLALWGDEMYRRADRQLDENAFNRFLDAGNEKYDLFIEESEDTARAFYRRGEALQWHAASVSPYLLELTPMALKTRKRVILGLALESYTQAYDLNRDSILYLKAASMANLKLSALAEDLNEFILYFDRASTLSLNALSRDPGLGSAWFNWGKELFNMESPPLPEAKERIIFAAIAAFGQSLRSNNSNIPDMKKMADLLFSSAIRVPASRIQALSLLSEICRRLMDLRPKEPSFKFAFGLSVFLRLDAEPAWPDDLDFTESPAAKRSFLELTFAFSEGLELLSTASPPKLDFSNGDSNARLNFRPDPDRLHFLEPEGFVRVTRPGASHSERLTNSFNLYVARLFTFANPQNLPPWYKLQLASFLRKSAATGYFPPQEQMAYFRIALVLLNQAEGNLTGSEASILLAPFILSEKGLILAELTLVIPEDSVALLEEASLAWQEAENLRPRSSDYARARWAAWQNDLVALEELLSHAALDEDKFFWPPYEEALLEPAFKRFATDAWFKNKWFGYFR
jgi:hypothetical protein